MTLEGAERAKYERMWRDDAYRKTAPGERLVGEAISSLGMSPGDSVLDLGCGTGRPAAALSRAGMHVTAVDFADNCLDSEVEVDFLRACLWQLPPWLCAEWGYCTDVLEHIPPERVDDTLAEVRRVSVRGAFMQIATGPDRMGRRIGETLHLTVRPPEWWRARLVALWPQSVRVRTTSHGLIAVCR